MKDRDWNSVGDEYSHVTVYDEGFNQVHISMLGDEMGDSITLDNRQALKLCDAISRTVWNQRKPWHDAQEGEVWLLSSEGEEHTWTAQKGEHDLVFCRYLPRTKTAYTQLIDDSNITAGRRIWPEEGGASKK